MIPLALGTAEYVSVIGAPFAITVIGGLALGTALTLILIPTVLPWIGKFHRMVSIFALVD